MPFIDGCSLDEHWTTLAAQDISGIRRSVSMFSKIAEAVEEAHKRGVVHRDLKPSNIRVDQRHEPHVLDFGLARSAKEDSALSARTITMSGQIIGSLPWASPEQAEGESKDLSPRSDVYALGVMLFQSLTGILPYSLQGPIDQVLLRIRTQVAEPPSKICGRRTGVDRSLDAIVLKALSKNPDHRYQSAGALSKDLKSWLAGDQVAALLFHPARPRWLNRAASVASACLIGSAFIFAAHRPADSRNGVVHLATMEDSSGIRLMRIPKGTFMIGSPDNEAGRRPNEHRQFISIASDFYIAATEVTQEQYQQVMGENPSDPRWSGPKLPVQNVSWDQAEDYCRRLSALERTHYRLPTEAEWEYACRANSLGPFPDPANPRMFSISADNSNGNIQPVAITQPNAWGLFDMQGNVREWCDGFEPSSELLANSGEFKPVRGGSAFSPTSQCRAASRQVASRFSHQPDLGFRVVRDP